MRILFVLFYLFYYTSICAQCDYGELRYDNATEKVYMQLAPITLDVFETPFNARIILAHLIRYGNQFFIEIEITTDSSALDIKPICFEKSDRLSLFLKNNNIINILQTDDKICGVTWRDRRSGFITVSNYARFTLTQHAFDELKKSDVALIKISSKNYEKTFVLGEELEEKIDNDLVTTIPGRFFIENIECLTNPNFN